ncbi:MAG: DUF2262 domain-containing protein [Reichenbachiella sp.]|uniref:DUF2262 domain-containing protein n=1 Tax=Reichenbachiella sp. TaxID=2184521 RepID=UPI00326459FF
MGPVAKYNERLGAFQSKHLVGIEYIQVDVHGPENMAREIHDNTVDRGIKYLTSRYSQLLTAISNELLEIKNDGWLRKNEAPLSEKKFRLLITPRRIELFEDGSIEIGWKDGGTFWGHEIVLRTDSNLTPNWIDIEG